MSTASSGFGISHRTIPEFRMSDVWNATWKMFSRNFRLFVSIVLVVTALVIPSAWLFLSSLLDRERPARLLAIVLSLIWMLVIGELGQALVTLVVFQKLHQQSATISANLARVASRAIPLLLTVLAVFAIAFVGLLALIIPGLIAFTVYSVAVAVCVVEGTGPGESLSRSAAMTHFHRWRIFGLAAELAIIGTVLDKIVELVRVRAFGQSATRFSLLLVKELVEVVPVAFVAVAWAVAYCQLRAIKDHELAPLAP